MTDPDVAEGIMNLPEHSRLHEVIVDYKPHVDGLPYRVVAVHVPRPNMVRSKPLQYFATAAEANRAAELINQHIAAVRRLTSSGS